MSIKSIKKYNTLELAKDYRRLQRKYHRSGAAARRRIDQIRAAMAAELGRRGINA